MPSRAAVFRRRTKCPRTKAYGEADRGRLSDEFELPFMDISRYQSKACPKLGPALRFGSRRRGWTSKRGIADGTTLFAATNERRKRRPGFRVGKPHRFCAASRHRARAGRYDDMDGSMSPVLGSQRRYRRGRQRGLDARPMPNMRRRDRASRERYLSREPDDTAAERIARRAR